MSPRVLLVSPVATHPQDQGNSARIFQVGRLLQSAGMIVHFLYYQTEGLTSQQRVAMMECWDHFHPVPTIAMEMRPSGDGYYRLDDWWPPIVGDTARQLHKRWRFQAVITNYVWFSGVLESFGPNVIKILDTHDMFAGRADNFVGSGLVPEWYYTSHLEEARGLSRADIVLAIQDEEADRFRALGHRDVRVLGHIPQGHASRLRPIVGGNITAGYLASGNPINVNSFERMRARLLVQQTQHESFIVAGSICKRLSSEITPFRSIGLIDHLDDFYDNIDLVLNPMAFGTGLKIKSVEAIFEGLPLVATECAMSGLPIKHSLHSLSSPEEVGDAVGKLNEATLIDLSAASRACAAEYARVVRSKGMALTRCIAGLA